MVSLWTVNRFYQIEFSEGFSNSDMHSRSQRAENIYRSELLGAIIICIDHVSIQSIMNNFYWMLL